MSTPGEHARETTVAPARPVPAAASTHVVSHAGNDSAVSWAAIFAGAVAAAALSLILLLLGVGFGLSTVSPWSFEGVSAEAFGWGTIIWICVTSILAAGLGGYIAGRLRTKWVSVHADEAYFRDTAHGFLAWAVATLLTAALLTSAVGGILSTGVQAGATAAGGVGAAATTAGAELVDDEDTEGTVDYFVDQLFRGSPGPATRAQQSMPPAMGGEAPAAAPMQQPRRPMQSSNGDAEAPRAEVARIFATNLRGDSLDQEDARYLAQVVSQRTGMSQEEAQTRVNDTYQRMQTRLDEMETQAREAADEARKAAAYAALWLFISLLMGAFVASLMATFGGRQRDL